MTSASSDLPAEALRHDATATAGTNGCEDPLRGRLREIVSGAAAADQGGTECTEELLERLFDAAVRPESFIDAGSVPALLKEVGLLWSFGRSGGAAKLLRMASSISPDDPTVKFRLAMGMRLSEMLDVSHV